MKKYTNFYETIQEAQARLSGTVVMYDGEPFYVLAITNHMSDGVFRVWLWPMLDMNAPSKIENPTLKEIWSTTGGYLHNADGYAPHLDACLEKDPDCGMLRKQMDSPKFNRFRPFPLGMCNVGTQCYYVERQPIRPSMHQGLTKSGLYETLITAGSRRDAPTRLNKTVQLISPELRDCILADHHSAFEALNALNNPKIANDAYGFSREFALVRGPMDLLFLAYRTDIIGVLPKRDFSLVNLGKEFQHCREVVEELELFYTID